MSLGAKIPHGLLRATNGNEETVEQSYGCTRYEDASQLLMGPEEVLDSTADTDYATALYLRKPFYFKSSKGVSLSTGGGGEALLGLVTVTRSNRSCTGQMGSLSGRARLLCLSV